MRTCTSSYLHDNIQIILTIPHALDTIRFPGFCKSFRSETLMALEPLHRLQCRSITSVANSSFFVLCCQSLLIAPPYCPPTTTLYGQIFAFQNYCCYNYAHVLYRMDIHIHVLHAITGETIYIVPPMHIIIWLYICTVCVIKIVWSLKTLLLQ